MAKEISDKFEIPQELVDRVFNYQNFYHFGLGSTKEHSDTLRNYDEAEKQFKEFRELMNYKFNSYIPEMKEYLIDEGVLMEVGSEGSGKCEITKFGFDCVKEYFYQKQKEDDGGIAHQMTREYLIENNYLDSKGKLSDKGLRVFMDGF